MERITSLIEQLQQAVKNKADVTQLLMLSNQLQAELQALVQQKAVTLGSQRVAVVLPASRVNSPVQKNVQTPAETTVPQPVQPSEKITEVLQVNEAEIEAELEEIRQKAEFAKKMQAQQHQNKSALLFEEEPEIPTLIHQPNYKEPEKPVEAKEVNEVVAPGTQLSINDQLGESKAELAHKLSESSHIRDLKKAIGINDRYVFINELFRGDEAMYERSIKTINSFSIYPEAQYWIERELKIKLGWLNDNAAVQEFYALVKRRFS
ncbi:MAG: hypothetical protein QM725_00755 [Lacibacter sp.]